MSSSAVRPATRATIASTSRPAAHRPGRRRPPGRTAAASARRRSPSGRRRSRPAGRSRAASSPASAAVAPITTARHHGAGRGARPAAPGPSHGARPAAGSCGRADPRRRAARRTPSGPARPGPPRRSSAAAGRAVGEPAPTGHDRRRPPRPRSRCAAGQQVVRHLGPAAARASKAGSTPADWVWAPVGSRPSASSRLR